MDGVFIPVIQDDFSVQDHRKKTQYSIHSRQGWFTLDHLWGFYGAFFIRYDRFSISLLSLSEAKHMNTCKKTT